MTRLSSSSVVIRFPLGPQSTSGRSQQEIAARPAVGSPIL
jgi:hypothetical protein